MSSRRVRIDFTWHHYFDLAKQLYEDSYKNDALSEALLRSTISRAYFATHCLARNYLINDRDLTPPEEKKEMHSWVINQIGKDPSTSRIHTNLSRLRDDRNNADYDDSIRNIKKMAEGAIIGARQAIDILDNI